MAEQPTYKFLPEDKCLSESQLFDYIDGKLKASDMHFIEKHILSCGFCSDALDGLEKVKRREKVAAFIPSPVLKEEKEEPKVIPLNPNRKYYALAAGIVLILGITLFLKLSTSADFSKELADVSRKDSMSLPNEETAKPAPPAVITEQLNESDTRAANDIVTQDAPKGTADPGFFDVAPPLADENYFVPEKSADELSAADKSITSGEADGDMDDYPNVVGAKLEDVQQREESSVAKKEKLSTPQPKKAASQDDESGKYKQNKDAEGKNDQQRVAEKDNTTKEVPVTLSTTAPTSVQTNSTVPAGTSSSEYLYSTPTTGSVTTDSVTYRITTKTPSDVELDLSYENANKMLASGQAAASLSLYDEVLKNPAHKNYHDAQWKKAEALIQLKRIDEAKKLLNEIVAKNGKYKAQAKEKLKSL